MNERASNAGARRTRAQSVPARTGRALLGWSVALLASAGACDGMSGLSDLEFGQGVGSPCANDTDCDRDTFCAPGVHRCEYQKEASTECQADNECKDHFCTDGVCCDAACDGTCESCVVPGSAGSCTAHGAGTDPDDECPGTPTCNGALACVGQNAWAVVFGDGDEQYGTQVAYDSAGNLVVAGTFEGEIELGGTGLTSQGEADVFLAKFDPTGELLWAQRFGGDGTQRLVSMVVDRQNRIVVGGNFSYGIQIGADQLVADDYSSEVFLAQFSSDGTPLWAREIDGSGGTQSCRDVAVDEDGNVAVTGMFSTDVTIGGDTYPWLPDHADMFLAKYDAQGTVVWSQVFTVESYYLDARAVAFDSAGNLIFGGDFSTDVDLGQGTLTHDGQDIFVAKYNSDGTAAWTMKFGGGNDQALSDVAVDSEQNILLTGWFAGGLSFGGSELTSEGDRDIFLAKLTPTGGHQWSRQFGGPFAQEGRSLGIGPGDAIVMTGTFTLGVNFGSVDADAHECTGADDAFLAKFDATGALVWSQPFGGLLDDIGASAALDAAGNAAITGTFEDRIEFGAERFLGKGLVDGFVAVFAP